MFNYTISTILDYFFASRGLNPQIQVNLCKKLFFLQNMGENLGTKMF